MSSLFFLDALQDKNVFNFKSLGLLTLLWAFRPASSTNLNPKFNTIKEVVYQKLFDQVSSFPPVWQDKNVHQLYSPLDFYIIVMSV